ncbi:hypothetical protein KNP414_06635 [Paenibacillus mucilaginosus KNP414]|uniref:Uncharacterized protein n=1 Tax=Paenibacillus mucilaginosus (strain KNP414) TaxID=1036673 RepID=F8F9V7_PAEMK|nr:hypothetical protein KNP414_06635 [Paenibacillus mucilaginosus KNP414]
MWGPFSFPWGILVQAYHVPGRADNDGRTAARSLAVIQYRFQILTNMEPNP